MENRIKDQQLGLFADRASSSDFHANQLRLLLCGLAHVLVEGMRCMAPSATELARATPQTIRTALLKVGALALSNSRRMRLRVAQLTDDESLVRLLMSRSHPGQDLFRRVAADLVPQLPWPPPSAGPGALTQAWGWEPCARTSGKPCRSDVP